MTSVKFFLEAVSSPSKQFYQHPIAHLKMGDINEYTNTRYTYTNAIAVELVLMLKQQGHTAQLNFISNPVPSSVGKVYP